MTGDARTDVYLPFLAHRRVAVVANHTSMVGNTHLVDTLRSLGVDLKTVFTPEHGFRGTADAGEHVESTADEGLRIISLYGKNRKPTPGQLADIDVVLYDLQDVGARFFTYISTMHNMMEACAEAGIPFVVLDRPNPQGDRIDGPVLESEQRSFVGMHTIPVLYGLTAGELACMINGEGWLAGAKICDLKVVTMLNYDPHPRHELRVAPSPNLRSPQAVRLYPSLCLFEATNVSVGRGTDDPFTVIGAPVDSLGQFEFTPQPNTGAKNPLHNGKHCFGDDLSKSDMQGFDLEKVIEYRQRMGGDAFWQNKSFFDRLAGTKTLRKQIDAGIPADSIRKTWQKGLREFDKKRSKYLLYSKKEAQSTAPIDWQKAMFAPEVDSILAGMTIDEKIGQLIWVTLNGYPQQRDIDYVKRSCLSGYAGGVLIMQGTSRMAQRVIGEIQQEAKTPVFFAIDGENGIARKFTDAVGFPLNMSLGAANDSALAELIGQRMAEQMKVVGLDINFAPVADVNTNPKNPIIGIRSFGEDAQRVATLSSAIAQGMQRRGCVAVLKHFPGHGDTSVDSHKALPVVKNSAQRIEEVDMTPFRAGARNGVMGIMSAHISVPELDPSGKAASLSKTMLCDILRNELHFEGLVISDAMNMAGIRISSGQEHPECLAITAGNDVAEFSLDVEKAIDQVKAALADSVLSEQELELKVRRVLAAKIWCGLMHKRSYFGAPEVLVNSIENEVLIDSAFSRSITVLRNPDEAMNTARPDDVFLTLGEWQCRGAQAVSEDNIRARVAAIPDSATVWIFFDEATIALYNQLISSMKSDQKVVSAYAGNPYRLQRAKQTPGAFVLVYESNARAKRSLVNFALYGGEATAVLPVSINGYKCGHGLNVKRSGE